MYSRELIEEVKRNSDIVSVVSNHVKLTAKGNYFTGKCPFHNDNSPSFTVYPTNNAYYCFGCGAGGDIFNFLQEAENYDFIGAIKHLAEKNGITLPEQEYDQSTKELNALKKRLIEIHKTAGLFYHNLLKSDAGENARVYLIERGLLKSTWTTFGLGYSGDKNHSLKKHLESKGFSIEDILESGLVLISKKDNCFYDRFQNRLMFPIFDANGNPVGFGARILEGEGAKYLNSPETKIFVKSNLLYGLNFARKSALKELILVEGYMDVISLHQGGFKNIVASLGTAFNKTHASNLQKYTNNIIILFDSDSPGTTAALKAIPILISSGLNVKVLQVKGGKDPDQFIKEQGSDEFSKLLGEAVHYISFQIKCLKEKYDLEKPDEKVEFIKKSAEILSTLGSEVERSVYQKEIHRLTNVEESAISKEVKSILSKKELEAESKLLYKNHSPIKIRNSHKSDPNSGVVDAQKHLLSFAIQKKEYFLVINKFLSKEYFSIPIYKETYEFLANQYKTQEKVHSNELIGHFTGRDDQKYIIKILAEKLEVEDTEVVQKSLTEMIKLLKISKIDLATNATPKTIENIAILNDLAIKRRELDKLVVILKQ